MELTKRQRLLLNGLELYKVEKPAIVGIVAALQEPEEIDALIKYMVQHHSATQEDILFATAGIKDGQLK